MQIKILVVDDDVNVLTTFSKSFTTIMSGYLVLTATSANAGIIMMKSERPDVIVLDVRLGPISGMDLLRDFNWWLDENKILDRPRFVVMTAYPDEAAKREALEKYKVDAFVMKPFEPKEIRRQVLRSVLRVLERKRQSVLGFLSPEERESL